MDNILSLHRDLKSGTYNHGGYVTFKISDPKPRIISKASVRDRLLHRAIYRILYPYFDEKFIFDSFSCRKHKGTHRAINRFHNFHYSASFYKTKTVYVLKCDIKRFFDSIDHNILMFILEKYIKDEHILNLINNIIDSFYKTPNKGLPLGNLTSQLLVNIYMNEFDQFMKHKLKMKYYIRYADDFVILSQDKNYLQQISLKIQSFLRQHLDLFLHPDKISIETFASGVDYLGWVNFTDHRVLRAVTKKRMFRNIKKDRENINIVQSYLGLLKHGSTKNLLMRLNELLIDQAELTFSKALQSSNVPPSSKKQPCI